MAARIEPAPDGPRPEGRVGEPSPDRFEVLRELERKVLWLASWTIHHANHVRPNEDGLKVGGHQASSASVVALMTALYFAILRPGDRVAVKPHASPAFHAVQYLFGRQTRENLERFRAFGGAQAYPSRTKDEDDVDFSTGSVGLGVAATLFASIVRDYIRSHEWEPRGGPDGRMIALAGDAELDEGEHLRGAAGGLEARGPEPVVDRRLQPAEPRLGDHRPAVRPVRRPVPEHGLAGGDPQVRQGVAAGVPSARGRRAPQVDRRLPEHPLLGNGVQGRGGVARAPHPGHREGRRDAGDPRRVRRRSARPADDEPRRPRHRGGGGSVRGGRGQRRTHLLHRLHDQGLRVAFRRSQGQPRGA